MDPNQLLISILSPVWEVIKTWWWLPTPFVLGRFFLFLWKWWRNDVFNSKNKRMLIEVRMPKEVLKPIRAMETVLSNLWQILYDPPDSWEAWIEGQFIMSYSLEIVSINGEPHFFIRFPESQKESVQAAIYSQYPDAEILIADDYVKHVPQDIPNKDWDLWGADYRLLKPNPYPIRTYIKFETEHEALEEKRIDPLATLLEAMAQTGPGEQIWVQFVIRPITDKEVHWVTEGEKIRDEIARREAPKSPIKRPILLEAADFWVTGAVPGGEPEKKEKELIPPEMKLTPGERETISAVETKISKLGFNTNVRFIYLGNKEGFFKPKMRLALSFFGAFTTQNTNAIVPHGQPYVTKVKKSWFLPMNLIRERRLYLRKRSIFRQYRMRVNPAYPGEGGTFVLNTEELATLFHFPGKASAPAPFVKRIESKKGEAPSELPVE